MSHTDQVVLALRALGETAGTPDDDEHTQSCAHCRHELARLSEVVGVARAAGPAEQLVSPPPEVWDRIAAALGTDATSPAATGTGPESAAAVRLLETTSGSNGYRPAAADSAQGPDPGAGPGAGRGAGPGARIRAAVSWRRGRLATTVAGLAAGLIIGIGGTVGVVQLTRAPANHVVAQIVLSPLPAFPQWHGATGTAVMRATAGQQEMEVTLSAPQRTGFYEVWLLARNGVSMISLGDLDAAHTGTFTVPPGVDLRNYSRIDVSLQPFDGSTLHTKTSVVRGSLPAIALGAGDGSVAPS